MNRMIVGMTMMVGVALTCACASDDTVGGMGGNTSAAGFTSVAGGGGGVGGGSAGGGGTAGAGDSMRPSSEDGTGAGFGQETGTGGGL